MNNDKVNNCITAVRATPVYFQLSGLTVRQNGIERVTSNNAVLA